jgi:hypothetical protein
MYVDCSVNNNIKIKYRYLVPGVDDMLDKFYESCIFLKN